MDELIKSINALVVAVEKMVEVQTESLEQKKVSDKLMADQIIKMNDLDDKFDIESKEISVEKDDSVTLLQGKT